MSQGSNNSYHMSSLRDINDLDQQIRNLSMNAPLTKGPLARWQRKNLEASSSSIINKSLNASLHLNCTVDDVLPSNISLSIPTSSSSQNSSNKTPTTTPTRSRPITPNNRSSSKLTASGNKLGGKTPKTPGPDRFIPDRSTMNLDVSHFLINQAMTENDNENDGQTRNVGGDDRSSRRALSEALNGDLTSHRIISCQEKSFNTSLKASQPNPLVKSAKKSGRYIPTQADRILDAPDIINDYYLQLVDWSDTNLLAVALNREVYIWNAISGDIQNLMQVAEGDYVSSLSWIQGGNTLSIGTGSYDIQLWDAESTKKLRTLRGHRSRVSCLSWNSYILSSGDRSGEIHSHDVRKPEHLVGKMLSHYQEVCGLKWSPSGQYLASGGNDNKVNIWPNMTAGNDTQPIYTLNEHQGAVKAIGWCPWRPNLFATGGGTSDKKLKIWNSNSGDCISSIDTNSQICSVIWSKDHQELITGQGYSKNELNIWKYPELTKVIELTGHTSRILGLSMSPDGATVVSVGADETLRFWDCFQNDKSRHNKSNTSRSKEHQTPYSMRLNIR